MPSKIHTLSDAQRQKRQQVSAPALLRSNRKLFITIAMFVWGWMLVYSLLMYVPKYSSQSLVLIKDSAITTRYVVPDQNYALQTTSSSSANPVLNTMGLLKSEYVSNALYRYLKKQCPETLIKRNIHTKAQWEAFYNQGKGFLKAKNEPGTDLISVQFTWSDPKIAQQGLSVILDAFQEASLEVSRSEQENRSRYLDAQIRDLEKQLLAVREEKSKYKSEMGIASLARQSDELAATGIDLATRLSGLEAQARGKEAEYRRYQKILNLSPETALTASALGMNKSLNKLQDQYYALSQNYALLKTTLTDKNPKVKEVRAQMLQVEEDIKAEIARTLGSPYSQGTTFAVADNSRSNVINLMVSAQADAIRLTTEAQTMRERLKEVDTQIETLPTLEERLNTIEEQERSLSNAVNSLRQKQLEAKVKQAETLSNVFVVDAPQLPSSAKFPRQIHLLILGFFMGLAAGAFAVWAKQKVLTAGLPEITWLNMLWEDDTPIGLQGLRTAKTEKPQKLQLVHPTPVVAMPVTDDNESLLTDLFGERTVTSTPNVERERTTRLKQRLYRELVIAAGNGKQAIQGPPVGRLIKRPAESVN